MQIPGRRVKKTRIVRTERLVVLIDVDAIIPEADPSEACYDPEVVELLREVQRRAEAGDVDWLRSRGKVYRAIGAA